MADNNIEQAANEYANNNFECCLYTYTEDKRLTNFDELKKAFIAGCEYFEDERKKHIRSVINSMPSDEDLMEDSKI